MCHNLASIIFFFAFFSCTKGWSHFLLFEGFCPLKCIFLQCSRPLMKQIGLGYWRNSLSWFLKPKSNIVWMMLVLLSLIRVQKMFWTFCQSTLYEITGQWYRLLAYLCSLEHLIRLTLGNSFHCYHINTYTRETIFWAVLLQESLVRLKWPLYPDFRAMGKSG